MHNMFMFRAAIRKRTCKHRQKYISCARFEPIDSMSIKFKRLMYYLRYVACLILYDISKCRYNLESAYIYASSTETQRHS